MKDYLINKNTLALIPLGKKKTIIYEDHDCYVIDSRINKIMDINCQYYGSSLENRIKGTNKMTGMNYKVPILLSEKPATIFFPTCSPRLKDCAWINLDNVDKVINLEDKCQVEFLNKEKLDFDSTYRVINNQYLRSLSLKNSFQNHKK